MPDFDTFIKARLSGAGNLADDPAIRHYIDDIMSESSRVNLAGFDLLERAPSRLTAPEFPAPSARSLEQAMMFTAQSVAGQIRTWLVD
ncbi:hypothetical protein ABI260_20715 [Pseudomonas guguanensis]|uniref:hypothetical protein n=1 Tax=Ectopseudomonas guguanensis TaxID=1198456 RepID=UPI00326666B3